MDATPDVRNYRVVEHLVDGREVIIRAVTLADRDALRAGFARLSPASIYFRFLGARRALTDSELDYFVSPDFTQHVAIGAEISGANGMRPVGIARYIRGGAPGEAVGGRNDAAEFAVAVDETQHGLGIGTLLLKHLAMIARAQGLARLEGSVLAANRDMLDVVAHLARQAGIPLHEHAADGVVSVVLDL